MVQDNKIMNNKNTKNSILSSDTKRAIIAIILFVLAVVSLLAAFKWGGNVGNAIFAIFQYAFGWGVYLVALSLLIISGLILKTETTSLCWITTSSIAIMFFSVLGIIQLIFGNLSSGQASGGQIGYWIGISMENMFAFPASLIILFSIFLIAFLVTTNVSLIAIWNKLRKRSSQTAQDKKDESVPNEKETIWPSLKKMLPSINFQKKTESEEFTKSKTLDEKQEKTAFTVSQGVASVSAGATADRSKSYNGFPLSLLEEGTKNGSQKNLSSENLAVNSNICLLYTSPSPRDRTRSRMPSSA